jgi:hypothetical protein
MTTQSGFLETQWIVKHAAGTETVFVSGRWTGHTANRFDGRYSAKNLAVISVCAPGARPPGPRAC